MPYRAIDSPLPLTPVAFEVLLALADEDLHGYAILRAVGERVRGVLPMRTGTLYRALASLLDDGSIDEIASSGDARRRVYRITPRGRRILRAEAERLAGQVAAARAKRVLSRKLS
jgi:DNA-binding PadR family transcriptional regulator